MISFVLACAAEAPTLRGESIGSCSYVSKFSGEPECREFYDTDTETATGSCDGSGATFESGRTCEDVPTLGACIWEDDGAQIRTEVQGDDAEKCGSNRFGCETFAAGYWQPSPTCAAGDEIVVLDDPFPLAERVCIDPLPGDPIGASEDGQVCTWEVVSGATEENRRFSEYASCEPVIRQRGYAPIPGNERSLVDDLRMNDLAYTTELDWVRGQIRSGSCDCCHSDYAAEGSAIFDTDFDGNMANQFNDRGLAMGAGWIPTVGFGTFPPEENNGFVRSSPENPYLSIIPTTDSDRMIRFFEGELAHRDLKPEDFEGDTYGAGPLDEQLNFEPGSCSDDEGIDENGKIRWLPGRARYVYVLAKDSISPTVPPNLDQPEGLMWRVDVPYDGDPVASNTVTYGVVPAGMTQNFPEAGAPAALTSGEEYYLYVTADVLFPISRCIFVAGEEAPVVGCNTAFSATDATNATVLIGLIAALRRRERASLKPTAAKQPNGPGVRAASAVGV